LDNHCAAIGRDPKEIKRTAVALLFLSDDEAFLAKMRDAGIEQATIIGTPAEVKEIVADYEASGVDELIVPDFTLGSGAQKIDTLDRFITDVAGR
jgi:alkanesulfonate monooxygenase SsuD/methylene tetrahydromethanopterin reductase-like flavin-dependent oxidoreductase (luciferase family)